MHMKFDNKDRQQNERVRDVQSWGSSRILIYNELRLRLGFWWMQPSLVLCLDNSFQQAFSRSLITVEHFNYTVPRTLKAIIVSCSGCTSITFVRTRNLHSPQSKF